MTIYYREGYKYQLAEDALFRTEIYPAQPIESPSGFISLSRNGVLTVKRGYAWDGPSGPTLDTEDFMQGSLAHDALYQLFREGLLDPDRYKDVVDRLLQDICIKDDMLEFKAALVYEGVKLGGGASTRRENRKEVLKAGVRL